MLGEHQVVADLGSVLQGLAWLVLDRHHTDAARSSRQVARTADQLIFGVSLNPHYLVDYIESSPPQQVVSELNFIMLRPDEQYAILHQTS